VLAVVGRALPAAWLGAAATQQDPLYCERPQLKGHVATLDYITTAWVSMEGSFDDYWSARGKNLRQNLRKQRRKLADEGIQTHVEVLTEPSLVAQGVADYAALEQAGWKSAGGTAVATDNAQGRFYKSMLEAYCASGRGKIVRYRFGERVVVVELCIESQDSLVILKTTHDESIRGYSLAALMREDLFQQWWREGKLRHVEFFGRAMDWHLRWTDHTRVLYHVNWYRWPSLMRAASRLAHRVRKREAAASEPQVAPA
jgi:hypothetical protein